MERDINLSDMVCSEYEPEWYDIDIEINIWN